MYGARKRFGLCVLDYQVTSNHAHLLVLDRGRDEIAAGMQLVAGRTGQDYNGRKSRRGAFWEDRYHATAVDTEEHLARCLVYVDLNMVRAGAVSHPRQWAEAGYHEIQRPRGKYRIIDRAALSQVLGCGAERAGESPRRMDRARSCRGDQRRESQWSEAIALGRQSFVEEVQRKLGSRARYRRIEGKAGTWVLRETAGAYTGHLAGEMGALTSNSAPDWG